MIDDPEGPHPHHGSSGIKWLDLALAVAVIVLSAASLWTAHGTGETMQQLVAENSRLVRANATPILQFTTSNVADGERALRFEVANVGTGTARVIWFELAKNGVPMPDYIQLFGYSPKASDQDYVPQSTLPDTYVPAGENRAILTWKRPTAPLSVIAWDRMDAGRGAITTTACFCSVLGECWISHLRADLPVAVKACDAKGHVSFGGVTVK